VEVFKVLVLGEFLESTSVALVIVATVEGVEGPEMGARVLRSSSVGTSDSECEILLDSSRTELT
jgi:hypothetical protein